MKEIKVNISDAEYDRLIEERKKEKKVEKNKPELDQDYYYVTSINSKGDDAWCNIGIDKDRLVAGNCFYGPNAEHDCDMEILRRESMAQRMPWEEFEKLDEFWHWNLMAQEPYDDSVFNKEECLPEWYIGSCHATEEECRAWGEKYAISFVEAKKIK